MGRAKYFLSGDIWKTTSPNFNSYLVLDVNK